MFLKNIGTEKFKNPRHLAGILYEPVIHLYIKKTKTRKFDPK